MAGLTTVLPNNYNRSNCEYNYKIVSGFLNSQFLNTADVIDDVTFANLRLSVFDVEGVEVISDVWPLSKVDLVGGYRLYINDMIIDSTLIPNKIYRLVIYDTTDNMVYYRLNWFKFISGSDSGQFVYLSYRNSTNIFNINYEELPDYRNKIFVDLNVISNEPEYDLTSYPEATTGFIRNQKSQLKDAYTIEGYFFDKTAFAGMKGLSMHDDIQLNFRDYQIKEGYQEEANIRTNQTKGTFEVYDQEANEINLKG